MKNMGRLCHHSEVFSFQAFPGTGLLQWINFNQCYCQAKSEIITKLNLLSIAFDRTNVVMCF